MIISVIWWFLQIPQFFNDCCRGPRGKTITSVYPMKLPSHCGLTNEGRKIIFKIGDLLKRICKYFHGIFMKIRPCSDFRAKTPYVPTDLSLISLIHRGTSLLSQNRTSDSHAEYNHRGGSRPPMFRGEKKVTKPSCVIFQCRNLLISPKAKVGNLP